MLLALLVGERLIRCYGEAVELLTVEILNHCILAEITYCFNF